MHIDSRRNRGLFDPLRSLRMTAGVWTAIILLATGPLHSNAATLNVVGGELIGAFGVEVGGVLYDVEFVDGTCPGLFSGCNEASDFTFPGTASDEPVLADDAAAALLDQVFITPDYQVYDEQPWLTRGCAYLASCDVITPYYSAGNWFFYGTVARNSTANLDPAAFEFGYFKRFDSSTAAAAVFALWTPAPAVPIPAALPLFVSAIVALGLIARRRRTHAA